MREAAPESAADGGRDATQPTGPAVAASERRKRPYEPPRITFREPLEGVAAVCGGTGKADPVFCPMGPLSS